MSKSRHQNPVISDYLNLKLTTFNSNSPSDAYNISKVEIYLLDKTQCSDCNPDGRVLVDTITDITNEDVGVNSIDLTLDSPTYTIGSYLDVWHVKFNENDATFSTIENKFKIFPDLWIASEDIFTPSFSWQFSPNRFRKGSIKYITIRLIPNSINKSTLEQYYTNLAISSEISITISTDCTPCSNNCEEDVIVDKELVTIRDKCYAFYKLDTSEDGLDLDIGIYKINFQLAYKDILEISDDFQIQIY